MELRNRHPIHVPLLTNFASCSSTSLTLGRVNLYWSMFLWENVVWSYESRFVIHCVDGRIRVRRLPGEQLLNQCTARHTQAGSGSIVLWGTFSWASLVMVEQTTKASDFLKIIVNQLHPYMSFQMQMESFNRRTLHVTRLEFFAGMILET